MGSRPGFWLVVALAVGLGGLFLARPPLAGGATFAEDAMLQVLAPAQSTLSGGGETASSFFQGLLRGWRLASENEALRSQTERLTAEVVRLRQVEAENADLSALLAYGRANPQWHYAAARVIGYDPQRIAQAVVMDKGSRDGVGPGMVVLAAGGLVGRVVQVAPSAAQVLLITDPRSAVGGEVQGKEVRGVVRAHGGGELRLDFAAEGSSVQRGDVVVTSGLGGTFPPGFLVGQVVSTEAASLAELFPVIALRPAVTFARLRSVLILMDFVPAVWP